jgi:hypothetical protein
MDAGLVDCMDTANPGLRKKPAHPDYLRAVAHQVCPGTGRLTSLAPEPPSNTKIASKIIGLSIVAIRNSSQGLSPLASLIKGMTNFPDTPRPYRQTPLKTFAKRR